MIDSGATVASHADDTTPYSANKANDLVIKIQMNRIKIIKQIVKKVIYYSQEIKVEMLMSTIIPSYRLHEKISAI